MEVNSSPGLEGIETATKLDVAGAIVDYIADQVGFPDIDVRQRLSLSTGYGVAEIARISTRPARIMEVYRQYARERSDGTAERNARAEVQAGCANGEGTSPEDTASNGTDAARSEHRFLDPLW